MRFFFHYNKPASSSANKPQVSIHYGKKCLIVDNLVCNVPTRGKIRKNQPRFIVTGSCESIDIIDNIAYIS